MIHQIFRSKRLLWLSLTILFSATYVFLFSAVFQPKSAAEAEVATSFPTLVTTEFNLADPYVCVIPDDGTFLPCHANLIADQLPIERSSVALVSNEPCVNGMAADYPCRGIDLLSHLPLSNFDNVRASDIWGWTDRSTGNEFVILTLRDHTAFVDISDPFNPVVVGKLPKTERSNASVWRDVKTYRDTAYIVADIAGPFGMQIFDLTRLRGVTQTTVFTADNLYTGISSTHNIVINEDSGLAALVGISTGEVRCSGGMHLLDLSIDQLNPTFAGCVDGDGYVHDAQCVIYHGSDDTYIGREICFNFNEDTITIIDVTDRANPVQLSRSSYSQTAYTHQGWLTADHNVLLVDDEGDEQKFDAKTTTYIWDLSSLTEPKQIGVYSAATEAIDHNQYIHLGYSFQSNYRAGLRILDVAEAYDGRLEEVAFFDIYPSNDEAKFNAAWSSYPYFESGVIALSGVEQGLFLVRPTNLLTQRTIIQMPTVVTVTPGASVDFEAVARTLGLTESFTLTAFSSGMEWNASTSHSTAFTGVATRPEKIGISVSAPLSESGDADVSLVLASVDRPGYVVTQTTRFRIEVGELFDVADPGQFNIDGNVIEKPILINNRSGLPERYSVEVQGDNWVIEPSVAQTPLIDGNESYALSLLILAGAGIQSSYTLTITPESDPAAAQLVEGEVQIETGASLSVESISSVTQITHTIDLTNSGDLPDYFDIQVDDGVWPSSLSISRTGVVSPNDSVEFKLFVTVDTENNSANTVRAVSGRSGQEVVVREIVSQIYRLNLPVIR